MLIFFFKTFSYRTLDESEFSPFLHSTSLSCRSLKKQKFGAKECKAKKCAFPQQCHRISQPIYQSQLTGLSIVTRHFLQILLNYKPFEACRGIFDHCDWHQSRSNERFISSSRRRLFKLRKLCDVTNPAVHIMRLQEQISSFDSRMEFENKYDLVRQI